MASRAEMSCELKVDINCDTCRHKVMDVLQNLHGVYSVVIDAEKGTVRVSGNVNPHIILNVFEKYGKHGEVSCVKFDGEVREPFYYPCHGGNCYIPPGFPLMGGPDYYSWCAPRPPPLPPPYLPHLPPPPPRPRPPPPPAAAAPPPVINYFPPKAPPVVAPPTEMNPEWCKIM